LLFCPSLFPYLSPLSLYLTPYLAPSPLSLFYYSITLSLSCYHSSLSPLSLPLPVTQWSFSFSPQTSAFNLPQSNDYDYILKPTLFRLQQSKVDKKEQFVQEKVSSLRPGSFHSLEQQQWE